ncbi:MAG: hypothetical protein ACYC9M_06540 [Desulfobulbaceae bacterium]
MKQHLFYIIVIVTGFSAFLMGYSLPSFLEVGFGGSDSAIGTGAETDADLLKYYEKLSKEVEE